MQHIIFTEGDQPDGMLRIWYIPFTNLDFWDRCTVEYSCFKSILKQEFLIQPTTVLEKKHALKSRLKN